MKTLKEIRCHGGKKRLKLLLVDDHEITLESLKLYFSTRSNFEVIAMIFESLSEVSKAKRTLADVVIMNMRMLLVDPAIATKLLLETLPEAKVIGFSGLEDRRAILSMIQAGARGYLLKGCSPIELFQAVETVSTGAPFFSAAVSKIIQDDYIRSHAAPNNAKTLELKDCERKVLTRIADGLSNKEIADALVMSVRTIEKYRESLMAKLQIKSVAGLTKFAVRTGISSLD